MGIMGMHPAVGQQPGQVQPAAGSLGFGDALQQHRVAEEIAVQDRLGDAGQILVDHPAGTDVEMTDLGVAHLALRQPHRHARSSDLHMGILFQQSGQIGGDRLGNGVVLGAGVDAPAIQNHQQQRFF